MSPSKKSDEPRYMSRTRRTHRMHITSRHGAGSSSESRSMLTCRRLSNAEMCSGSADWAPGFAGVLAEHALPLMLRLGAVGWLARGALRDEERAA